MGDIKISRFWFLFLLVLALFILFCFFGYFVFKGVDFSESKKIGTSKNKDAEIALVKVEGVIMDAETTIELLQKAEMNKKFKAIILRIDSPGGAVGPSQEIYQEIERINKVKPIYASMGTVAASGGYYIASATRKIFANPGTLTGSIGVIMNFMNLSEIYQWLKIKPQTIKAGKYKDIGSSSREMSEEELKILNEMLADVHEQFMEDILKYRQKKLQKDIREIAQGQIYSGREALKLGLVDELAGLWQAKRRIAKELKISEDTNFEEMEEDPDNKIWKYFEKIQENTSQLTRLMNSHNKPMMVNE